MHTFEVLLAQVSYIFFSNVVKTNGSTASKRLEVVGVPKEAVQMLSRQLKLLETSQVVEVDCPAFICSPSPKFDADQVRFPDTKS